MTAWDSLPAPLRSGGALDRLRPLLSNVDVDPPVDGPLPGESGIWRRWTGRLAGAVGPLGFDPTTGAFGSVPPNTSTPVELADPTVDVELAILLDGAGNLTDTVRTRATTPRAAVKLPFWTSAGRSCCGRPDRCFCARA